MDRRSFFSRIGIGAGALALARTATPEVALQSHSPEIQFPCAVLRDTIPAGYFYALVTRMESDANVTRIDANLASVAPVTSLTVNGFAIPKDGPDIITWRQVGHMAEILVPNELLSNIKSDDIPTVLALQPSVILKKMKHGFRPEIRG